MLRYSIGMFYILVLVNFLFKCVSSEACSFTLPDYSKSEFSKQLLPLKVIYRQDKPIATDAIVDYIDILGKKESISIYDVTHDLLVPLNFAFAQNDIKLLRSFDGFFSDKLIENALETGQFNDLERLHFAYLTSEYLRLSSGTKMIDSKKEDFYKRIKKFVMSQWLEVKGNNWTGEACDFIGKRSRVAYILTHNAYPKNKEYYGAVTDGDLFTMAVGVNLASYELQNSGSISPEIQELVYYFLQTLKKKSFFNSSGGWELDRGLWTNHPDYLYAGNSGLSQKMAIRKVKYIGWDASHFSRMPAFLNSLSSILDPKSTNGIFVQKIKRGLTKQFLNKVVVKPDLNSKFYLFKNFMNGSNGIFRYKYVTSPEGYKPFGNFDHIFYGWWSLLNNHDIDNIYGSIHNNLEMYKIPKSKSKIYIKEIMEMCSINRGIGNN